MIIPLLSLFAGMRRRRQAIPALLMGLKSRNTRMRREAAATLFRIAAFYDRVRPLEELHSPLSRWLSRRCFGGQSDPAAIDAVPALKHALRDGDAVVRFHAARALRNIPGVTGTETHIDELRLLPG